MHDRPADTQERADAGAGFEVRLRDPQGEALDALYTLHVAAVECAEDTCQQFRVFAPDSHGSSGTLTALVGIRSRQRLHVRVDDGSISLLLGTLVTSAVVLPQGRIAMAYPTACIRPLA